MRESKKVFVTGLVRSRTAWMANLLTWGKTICCHDVFVGLNSPEELKSKLDKTHADVVGVSDPALLLCWDDVARWYPDAKWIVIERNFEDVVESCKKFGIGRQPLSRSLYQLEYLKSNLSPMVLKFEDINVEVVKRMEDYLGVNCGPFERIEMLLGMNVQAEASRLKENMETIKTNPPRWLMELEAA